MRIGIPRALLYYNYYPFWKIFFESLGHEVVLSSPTNKKILKDGLESTVDDACLPVKVFHGHVIDLINTVDAVFIPRIISVESGEFICPKFLGLPDMIRNSVAGLPRIIDCELSLYRNKTGFMEHAIRVGRLLGNSTQEALRAYLLASSKYNSYKKFRVKNGRLPIDEGDKSFFEVTAPDYSKYKDGSFKFNVLVLGHPYNIYDRYVSMNLIKKLQDFGAKIITPEIIPERNISAGAKKLNKKLFWTLGKNILGSAYYYMDNCKLDGIVHVASFGCGPDSLVGELLERKVSRDYSLPFLYLNLDEHAGEEGFNTRLEAFVDILERRRCGESNVSSHG
ncbi:acyl-CoA dehydratase activase-related protein [Thermosediminibacter litoriperuensis]|uniref:Putative nucleotide-binding protein (Sugar kinase/HSP70/actin superfamily) n=1 Tax=Thermosediminibacter litoriperuensis TaxID=291989 RepID=A0A5S5AQG3_9FIRM|nr:acyl-CoA dehydratase activase-related protein [Thermosediminibacter litoriperuensis]TYP54271.1 putative nucleotide-binding protein (sugar kinase/HSP70/actin superfamily) [Thermosediminibacter litoriperuensis]